MDGGRWTQDDLVCAVNIKCPSAVMSLFAFGSENIVVLLKYNCLNFRYYIFAVGHTLFKAQRV
jgi:hypothetical protein